MRSICAFLVFWETTGVRGDRDCDYFFPYGMNGSKKVGKFLKDNNIGEIDKSSKLILVNGDDKIIWIVGMRLDDRFSINNETKNLLNIEYHK